MVRSNRSKRTDIVVSEIAGVIIAFGEREPFLSEDVAKCAEVERLAVGENAVEVEDDGANHDFIFSPA